MGTGPNVSGRGEKRSENTAGNNCDWGEVCLQDSGLLTTKALEALLRKTL